MIKKILMILAALLPLTIAAQTVGSWKQYPLYNGKPTAVIATPSKVYYTSQGRLYSYDPSAEESIDYASMLNGKRVEHVEYNPAGKYLFVGFDDGNIDLLYDNGDVYNLSDIKDAALRGDKKINDVDFNGDNIYVATSFGLVVIDAARKVVVKSGIYERNIPYVAAGGGYIVISVDNVTYTAPISAQINRFENFTKVEDRVIKQMMALDSAKGRVAFIGNNSVAGVFDVNVDGGLTQVELSTAPDNVRDLMPSTEGVYLLSGGRLTLIKPDASVSYLGYLPQDINVGVVASCKGLGEVWCGKESGVSLYEIGNSTVVKVSDVKPAGAVGVEWVKFITPSPDGKRIYVSNVGASWSVAEGGRSAVQTTYIVEGDDVRDVSSQDPIIKNPGPIAEDPDNSGRYFFSALDNKMYLIEDRKGYHLTGSAVLPLDSRIMGMAIDPSGNLWTMALDGARKNSINMLPSAKRKGDPKDIKAADWQRCNIDGFQSHYDGQFLFCKKSPMIVATTEHSSDGILFIHTNGTPDDVSDDRYIILNDFIDQDGKSTNVKDVSGIEEDNNGVVWFTTKYGIFMVTDPTKALDPSFTAVRVKVPRNDGTGFADYLLDGESYTDISVDANNNKWISTLTSGVYQVSPNGDEILQNFTPDNSPLPSMMATAIYADKLTNRVFVGTLNGLYCYYNTSSPAQPDYSDVYAFPNPVKPGYTGWISITNLMDNSLVKIMDSAGQLVAQGRSEGGMFSWDGCNSAGRRVPSGVYYVFASQSSGESSSGAVTKILVMN